MTSADVIVTADVVDVVVTDDVIEVVPSGFIQPSGGGVPDGGTAGQLIVKQSGTDGDTAWESVSGAINLGADGTATLTATAAEFVRDTIGTALTAGARITVTVNDPGDTITIAVSGLQTSDLSDFATAVDERARDALGAALTAGSNITITPNDGADTITIAVSGLTSGSLSDFTEAVQDVVGAMSVAGTGLTVTYSDPAGTLTLGVDTTAEAERIDDRVAALLVAGSGIGLSYNDSANTLTITATGALADAGSVTTASTLTASANTLHRIDTTSNACTVTIPASQAVGTQIELKLVKPNPVVNYVTYNLSGSDVFNYAGGATSGQLKITGHAVVMLYIGSNVWVITGDDLSLTQLDARYAPLPLVLPRPGNLISIGHSYTQKGGGSDDVRGDFTAFTHRVAAGLNIPPTEVTLYGHSGATGGLPQIGDTAAGIGGVFRHVFPNHFYAGGSRTDARQSSKCAPGLNLICLGINDSVVQSTNGSSVVTAFTNGMRALLSRLRAGRLYDIGQTSVFTTFSGTWSAAQTDKNYVTLGTYRKTSTNGDYVEVTLPPTYQGEPISLGILGNPNANAVLSSSMDASQTTVPVSGTNSGRTNFPQSGNFVIKIDSEEMLITAGQGTGSGSFTSVTRGYNGTTAATHNSGTHFVRAADTALVTVSQSGGTSGYSSTFSIAAQGMQGNDIQMVKRITTLTAGDAGSVLRFTVSQLQANENFSVFDFLIEDADPPVQVLVNQPDGDFASIWVVVGPSQNAAMNNVLTSLASEFTNCYVADVATEIANRYGAAVATGHAVGSGDSSITIAPVNAGTCLITKGSVLTTSGFEKMRVSSVPDKVTNAPFWTMNVDRAYAGVDVGVASVAATTHAVGDAVYDRRWLTWDDIHPSELGHQIYASIVLAKVASVPWTPAMIANSGGYVAHDDQRWPSPASGVAYPLVRQNFGSGRTTNAFTQSTEYAEPFWIPGNGILTYFGAWVTATAASSVLRFGFYADDNGAPGPLLLDAGTADSHTATGFVSVACLVPVKRGWYWRSITPQAGAPTLTALAVQNGPPPGYLIAEPTSNLNGNAPVGLSQTSITGALAAWAQGLTNPIAANAKFPLIACGYERYITD